MQVKRILTADGSDSLYVAALDETYHSKHGAIQESDHVFIKNGLLHYLEKTDKKVVNILEFGFGTGLNVLLTYKAAEQYTISYCTLEKYPLARAEMEQLNHDDKLDLQEFFKNMINSPWESREPVAPRFELEKKEIDFTDYVPETSYDVVYFDAFAPSKQPELWTIDILEKSYASLVEGGVFVTYSAKGQLRRDLQELGFTVERLPGPPGKYEMIRATKN